MRRPYWKVVDRVAWVSNPISRSRPAHLATLFSAFTSEEPVASCGGPEVAAIHCVSTATAQSIDPDAILDQNARGFVEHCEYGASVQP